MAEISVFRRVCDRIVRPQTFHVLRGYVIPSATAGAEGITDPPERNPSSLLSVCRRPANALEKCLACIRTLGWGPAAAPVSVRPSVRPSVCLCVCVCVCVCVCPSHSNYFGAL